MTTELLPAVPGVFTLYDTKGFPIEMSVAILAEAGMRVDWLDFIVSARDAGWTNEKIRKTAIFAIQESCVWDREYLKTFTERLDTTLALPILSPKMQKELEEGT